MKQQRHPDTLYRGERIEGPKGEYRGVRVTVNGNALPVPTDRPHQIASGVEWGYRGAGAQLLAYALILDATGDRAIAERAFVWFSHGPVSRWGSSWKITAGRIFEWIEQCEREDPEQGDDPHVVGPKLAVDLPQASRKGGAR